MWQKGKNTKEISLNKRRWRDWGLTNRMWKLVLYIIEYFIYFPLEVFKKKIQAIKISNANTFKFLTIKNSFNRQPYYSKIYWNYFVPSAMPETINIYYPIYSWQKSYESGFIPNLVLWMKKFRLRDVQ